MPSKLTVYIDDSLRQLLKESASGKSMSKLVTEALESYMSESLIKDLDPPDPKKLGSFPSVSEVEKRRPKVKDSSAEIIARQRRGRNARLSR